MLPRYEKKHFMVEVTTNILTAQSTRRLWLVRHRLTEWNTQQRFCGHSDISLSEQGGTQALWLAQRLEGEKISPICTSDLVRVHETGEIIAPQRTPVGKLGGSAGGRG